MVAQSSRFCLVILLEGSFMFQEQSLPFHVPPIAAETAV
jgi:hypothetical protein